MADCHFGYTNKNSLRKETGSGHFDFCFVVFLFRKWKKHDLKNIFSKFLPFVKIK
jgi:hypothetical protein